MRPLLLAMQGAAVRPDTGKAALAHDLPPEGPRQHYLRATLRDDGGPPTIAPFRDQDSARLSLMAQADALLVRPPDDPARKAGEVVDFIRLRS